MTGYDKVRKGYKWEVLALLWVAYLRRTDRYSTWCFRSSARTWG